tara:strand:- start:728 stop:1357 length:630 start_codon:yes stop_codon:yes gene_type:complete
MSTDQRIDSLKEIDQITTPDPRQMLFSQSLEDRHTRLAEITLKKSVPPEVRQLFETAKNISLYSWFVYRFHQASEMIAYSVLEMSLRLRYELENPDCKKPPMLYGLIEHAINQQWISKENFPQLLLQAKNAADFQKTIEAAKKLNQPGDEIAIDEPSEEDIKYHLQNTNLKFLFSIPKLRNDLAHGSDALSPSSISTLRRIANIINQIH